MKYELRMAKTEPGAPSTWNKVPAGFRKLTGQQMAGTRLWREMPRTVEHRQFINPETGKWADWKLFTFADETGLAMAACWQTGELFYYAFGCDHKMALVENLGRCYNRYACATCGYAENVDSSD